LEVLLRLAWLGSGGGLFSLVVALVVSLHGIVLAEIREEELWSIDFGAISVSEALDQLAQLTGIKIVTEARLTQKIAPKSYKNRSIEQILKDLLKNVNSAAVWNYSEKGVESIGILAFDRQKADSTPAVSAGGAGPMARPIPRVSRPRRLPPNVKVGIPEREDVGESPAETEGTEGGEAEDGVEQSEESSADDTSDQGSSRPRIKPHTDASSGEQVHSEDQQDEGKD
jgi:hypothetical protein